MASLSKAPMRRARLRREREARMGGVEVAAQEGNAEGSAEPEQRDALGGLIERRARVPPWQLCTLLSATSSRAYMNYHVT